MGVEDAFLILNFPSSHTAKTIARAASVVADEWLRLRRENTTLRAGLHTLRAEMDEIEKELDDTIAILEAADAAQVDA